VNYVGIDLSDTVLADCRQRFPQARWEHGSVLDLAYTAEAFDVVYARHLLDHLPYYETAVREMFRVARHAVMICLFQVPAEPERLLRRETANGYIWLNRYAPGPFEALLDSLSVSVEAQDVSMARRIDRLYFCAKADCPQQSSA
jgi:ubiquinone/menaquinone biosynthesis C-methylase UbiE